MDSALTYSELILNWLNMSSDSIRLLRSDMMKTFFLQSVESVIFVLQKYIENLKYQPYFLGKI